MRGAETLNLAVGFNYNCVFDQRIIVFCFAVELKAQDSHSLIQLLAVMLLSLFICSEKEWESDTSQQFS